MREMRSAFYQTRERIAQGITDRCGPPRGFAFAWFKIGKEDVGVYSVHLKSNLIIRFPNSDRASP